MARPKWTKLAAAATIGLAVSTVAGLHAASMVTTRSNPAGALTLFGPNAAAREDLAYAAFTAQVNEADDLREAAQNVRSEALEAYRSDPSRARALALLAIAIPEAERRNEAVLLASQLNRRDLTLQGLALETHLARKDTTKVLETLDQFLRVRPSYNQEFFPLLGDAFRDPENVPDFIRLFDGSSLWHEKFFVTYAARQTDLLSNLATVRIARKIGDDTFDQRLVSSLAKAGDIASAQRLIEAISPGTTDTDGETEALGWTSQYPPFDWSFQDRGNFRAQASRDGSVMEIFVRPGQGGVIAERIVAMPDAPFTITLSQEAQNRSQAENVQLQLRCAGRQQVFFEQSLANGANTIRVENAPDCDQMTLSIDARAFRGEPTLTSELGRITIR